MPQLKNSEKRLLLIFGVLIFGLGNLFLFSFGKKKWNELTSTRDRVEAQLNGYKLELPEKQKWELRRQWLGQNQPLFTTEEDKAPKLQSSIDEMALLTGVSVTIKPIEHGVEIYHQHIGVSVDVRGAANEVLQFASLLQDQSKFREVTSFSVKSEKNDPSRLLLQFTLQELYSLNLADPPSLETEGPTEATAAAAVETNTAEEESIPLPTS
ncbi:MAG: hypothetical protein AAGA58_02470 [Verrucomicrobiota bacterium]